MDLGTSKTVHEPTFRMAVMTRPAILFAATLLACSSRCILTAAAGTEAAYMIIKSLEGLGSTPCALLEGKDGRLWKTVVSTKVYLAQATARSSN